MTPGPSWRRRAALTLGLLASIATTQAAAGPGSWVGTWSTSPHAPYYGWSPLVPPLANQTIREIVHVSVGGERVRIRVSNLYGRKPLKLGAARIARQQAGSTLVPGTTRTLTFDGRPSLTLAPGQTAVSDPVDLQVPPLSNLAISLYVARELMPTLHHTSQQQNYALGPGNHVDAASMPAAKVCNPQLPVLGCPSPWYALTDVEVQTSQEVPVVVAFGDSITDGFGSAIDANHRWPDYLARRLAATGQQVSVLNQGITGNQLLRMSLSAGGLERFQRDVLAKPGVTHVVVLLGINDITSGASARQLIAGLQQLIVRAHAKGLRIFGGTLVPYADAPDAREAERQALNQWIRTSGQFDAVFDFDAALRDPANPRRMLAKFDCGDALHPNDAGYEAMAAVVDLKLFRNPAEAWQ